MFITQSGIAVNAITAQYCLLIVQYALSIHQYMRIFLHGYFTLHKKSILCNLELIIGTAVLPMAIKIKILGIYTCHDLNWCYQISCVRRK